MMRDILVFMILLLGTVAPALAQDAPAPAEAPPGVAATAVEATPAAAVEATPAAAVEAGPSATVGTAPAGAVEAGSGVPSGPLGNASGTGEAMRPPSVAAGPPGSAPAAPSPRTPAHWYAMGGWIMHLLALCSVLVGAIGLERAVTLRRSRVVPRALARELTRLAKERDLQALARACDESTSVLASLVGLAVHQRIQGAHDARDVVESAGGSAVMRLQRNMTLLAAVANIATLLGLLGTVLGMIEAFDRIALVGTSDARVVASGIFEALVTTAGGLSVAIVGLGLHAMFRRRIETYTAELETQVADILDPRQTPGAEDVRAAGDLAGAEA